MKNVFYIVPLFAVMSLSAQSGKRQAELAGRDTVTVNRQFQQPSDMKTMDAVKTHESNSPGPKPKIASKSKDTTKVKKRAQR